MINRTFTFDGREYVGQNVMLDLVNRYVKVSNQTFIKYRKMGMFPVHRYEPMYWGKRISPLWEANDKVDTSKLIAKAIKDYRLGGKKISLEWIKEKIKFEMNLISVDIRNYRGK